MSKSRFHSSTHSREGQDIGYSLGTKNKSLKTNADGSLTIYVQADPPPQRDNWLPAPKSAEFSLFMRAYWPKTPVLDGSWTPPAVQKVE